MSLDIAGNPDAYLQLIRGEQRQWQITGFDATGLTETSFRSWIKDGNNVFQGAFYVSIIDDPIDVETNRDPIRKRASIGIRLPLSLALAVGEYTYDCAIVDSAGVETKRVGPGVLEVVEGVTNVVGLSDLDGSTHTAGDAIQLDLVVQQVLDNTTGEPLDMAGTTASIAVADLSYSASLTRTVNEAQVVRFEDSIAGTETSGVTSSTNYDYTITVTTPDSKTHGYTGSFTVAPAS